MMAKVLSAFDTYNFPESDSIDLMLRELTAIGSVRIFAPSPTYSDYHALLKGSI